MVIASKGHFCKIIISALVMKKYSRTFPKWSPKMRRVSGRLQEVVCTRSFHLACEQAFRGALAAGQEKERSLQLCLWNLNSTSNSPVAPHWLSCQISANQREAETSTNVNKHRKTCAKGNEVITMSSPRISILQQLFWRRYSNSRNIVASSPYFSCPATRAPHESLLAG